MPAPFRKVAIVDVGDAAPRLMRAVRDHAATLGVPMATVALELGRARLVLAREADELLRVDVVAADSTWPTRIVKELMRHGVDAVFPGWSDPGALASLARACEAAGIVYIGSSADALAQLPRVATPATNMRRLEVIVAIDHAGTSACLGVVDTSISRYDDIVMAEYDGVMPQALAAEAEERARAARLSGIVTVVFLVAPDGATSYLGILPCLPWTHSLVDGIDHGTLQLALAQGERFDAPERVPVPGPRYAMGVRVALRDPDSGTLAPTGGKLALLRSPTGPGIRIDAALEPGDALGASDDPTLLRIVASGHDRAEAYTRLRRALRDLAIVVEDGSCDKSFVQRVLDRPEVEARRATLSFLPNACGTLCHAAADHSAVSLIAAAIDAYDVALDADLERFAKSAERGRPETRHEVGLGLELRHLSRQGVGHLHQIHVERIGRDRYRLRLSGRQLDVERRRLGPYEARLGIGSRALRTITSRHGQTQVRVEVEGTPHVLERDPHRTILAPAPAVVARVEKRVGDAVVQGERLVTLEAMKLEMPVLAPVAGRVRAVRTIANEQVGTGAPLMVIEPDGPMTVAGDEPPLDWGSLAEATNQRTPGEALAANHRDCLAFLCGFDVSPSAAQALVAARKALHKALADDDPRLLASEEEILEAFADIQSLFRRRAAVDETEAGIERSAQEYLFLYLRNRDLAHPSLPASFVAKLQTALARYHDLALDEALYLLTRARARLEAQASLVAAILERRLAKQLPVTETLREALDRIALVTRAPLPGVADLARLAKHVGHDDALLQQARNAAYADMEQHIAALCESPEAADRESRIAALVSCPHPLTRLLNHNFPSAGPAARKIYLEVVVRRYYRIRDLRDVVTCSRDGHELLAASYDHEGRQIQVRASWAPFEGVRNALAMLAAEVRAVGDHEDVVLDLVLGATPTDRSADTLADELRTALENAGFGRPIRRVVFLVPRGAQATAQYFTYRPAPNGFVEDRAYRGLHPMMGKRLDMWRLSGFDLERLDSTDEVYLFRAVAHENPKDERFLALAEVRDLTPVRDASGRIVGLPQLERVSSECFAAIRQHNLRRPPGERLFWNRVYLHIRAPFDVPFDDMALVARRLAGETEGLGLEKVVARARVKDPKSGDIRDVILEMDSPNGTDLSLRVREPGTRPVRPLSEYAQKVIRARQLGLTYPYEIIRMLTPGVAESDATFPPGRFVEHDLDVAGDYLVPVVRAPGMNTANLIVGVVTNFTTKYPEGVTRVVMLGDPLRAMGSIAEPECRRLVAALDLAATMGVPVEWYAVCAGARIAMDTGTENLDWTARGIRKLIEHTQAGHEINVVVCGINVGAQSYWNSEATMLNHTKGILIMVPSGAMVLTGKMALDYSGSVSADDNFGIGGYEHIMGRNGEAQYWAPDIREACRILLMHYDIAYLNPGERFPRRALTADPLTRDVSSAPHAPVPGVPFHTVGEVLSPATNPERKLPFSIREVMRAIFDQDHGTLERWGAMVDAEIAVVWDGHLGGWPVCMIGIESRPLPRTGWVPADGPQEFTAATLFPQSSKKIARAINACSHNRPVVILANLSGFDGSPESMRKRQLEYGAEIARSVVNFKGPIVFCVIARYHGGAYVVFSNRLQDQVEVAALEGTYASVIGGAPAAAVVFAGEVKKRTAKDPRIAALQKQIEGAAESERAPLRQKLAEVNALVRSEKLGEVAVEFDNVHTVKRAQAVGSIDALVPPSQLRPYLIDAVERGIRKTLGA